MQPLHGVAAEHQFHAGGGTGGGALASEEERLLAGGQSGLGVAGVGDERSAEFGALEQGEVGAFAGETGVAYPPRIRHRSSLPAIRTSASTTSTNWGGSREVHESRRLRLLSSGANTYSRNYLAETEDGSAMPMLNVFRRNGDEIRHFWGSEMLYAPTDPGQDPRHVSTLEPLWNMFDLTPDGRAADWDEQLSYS